MVGWFMKKAGCFLSVQRERDLFGGRRKSTTFLKRTCYELFIKTIKEKDDEENKEEVRERGLERK